MPGSGSYTNEEYDAESQSFGFEQFEMQDELASSVELLPEQLHVAPV